MPGPDRLQLDLDAACACGAVTLLVKGPALSMLVCACLDCQRATGTGHSSVVIVPAEALAIDGEVKGFDSPSESGATFTRHFCPVCATPLFGRSSRAPAIRQIPVGLFAGRNDWFAPARMIFARSHRHWDSVPETLQRHETYPG